MRRRLFVALLAAGLLVVAGFTAAAVASGGSPFALLEDQSRTADETTTAPTAAPTPAPTTGATGEPAAPVTPTPDPTPTAGP